MASDGCCGEQLFNFLLMVRALNSGQTQDVEGIISRLQYMTTVARRMEIAGADSRMSMHIGDPVDPGRCAVLHKEVLEFIASEQHMSKILPVPTCDGPDLPRAWIDHGANGRVTMSLLYAIGFNASLRKQVSGNLGARYVYVVGADCSDGCEALVFPWSYYAKVFASVGVVRLITDSWRFALNWPLCATNFRDYLQSPRLAGHLWKRSFLQLMILRLVDVPAL
jgi:hypothetical protein